MQEIQEMQVQSLGEEDPLEEERATHSSTPAWEIPWAEEPGRLQSMGVTKSRTGFCNYATSLASSAPAHQGLWYIKHFPQILHCGGLSQLCQWLRVREIILQGKYPHTKLFSVILAGSPTISLDSDTTCLGRA